MPHKAEIIAWKQLNDTTIAFLARCCGDKSTDSWHEVMNLHMFENVEVEKSVKIHMSNVETKHQGTERVRGHIASIFPTAKYHSGEIPCETLHASHLHPSELKESST